MRIYRLIAAISWICFAMLGCTEQPLVTELEVLPKVFSIKSEKFYAKPFTVRARYSDGKTVNVTKKVTWVSENSALVGVNAKGELQKQGSCPQKVCIVSLVVTDPESGQSQRVEVKLYPDKQEKPPVKKEENSTKQDIDVEPEAQAPESPTSQSEVGENVVEKDLQTGNVLSGSNNNDVNATSLPNTKSVVKKNQLIGFKQSRLELLSGELVIPKFVLTGDEGKGGFVDMQFVSCSIESSEPDVVIVEERCSLRALAPGNASVLVKSDVYSIGDAAVLSLQVRAKEVSVGDLSQSLFQIPGAQQQQWFKVNNMQSGVVQRISAKGALSPGFQVFVIPTMESGQGTCINTVPFASQQVACLVRPLFDHVFVMLHKPGPSAAQAQLSAEQLPFDFMDYSYLNGTAKPQQLVAESKFYAFILANELGVFNRHYYAFAPATNEKANKRIVLSGFDAPPGLEVFWANGYCAGNKLIRESGMVYCDLPDDAEGEISIIVIGNNTGGGNSSALAEKGGTFYEVLVTNQ